MHNYVQTIKLWFVIKKGKKLDGEVHVRNFGDVEQMRKFFFRCLPEIF